MMNVVAICLVLTTLATAGVWSPTPEKVNTKQDFIVKEGHRTVVVEFEKDDGNTKVSISPHDASKVDEKGRHDSTIKGKISDTMENVKEKLEEENGHKATPIELVCDAYGKCKHKIASAIGKTKEMVSEKAHEAADKAYEMEEEATEAVGEAFGKVKDTVTKKVHEASDKAKEAKEKVKDAAGEVSDKAKEAKERVKDAASGFSDKAKETVAEKAHGIKEGVKDKVEKVKKGAEEPVDTTKTLIGEAERNASNKMESAKRKASGKVKEAEEKIEQVSEKEKKDLKDIFRRGGEVVSDVFGYVFSPESMASGMGILQLLGLATAYGMSIWVTFISSYVLAEALPRQQFAIVQSKIYPVYFRAMAYSVGTVLLGHLLSQRKKLFGAAEFFQGFNLLASLFLLLFNLRYLEPRATKVMFERLKLEKEEGRGLESSTAEPTFRMVDSVTEASGGLSSAATTRVPSSSPQEKHENGAAVKSEIVRLSETLKKLNSYSSLLNVFTLMALTWHLVHLGQRLHIVC